MACGSRRPAGGGLRCGHGCLQWGGAGGGVVASRARSTPLYTRPRPRRWSNGSPSPRHARASPSYRARPPLPQRWGGSHGAPARLRLDAASAWLLTRGGLAESPWSSSSAKKKRVSGTKTSGVHRLGGSQPDPEDTDRQTHHPDRRRGIRDTPKHPHEQHKRNIHTCAAPVLSGLTRRRAGTSVVAAVAAAAAVGRFASSPPSAVLYAARGAADRVGPKKSSS